MTQDNIVGAQLWIDLRDASGSVINSAEHPGLYFGLDVEGNNISFPRPGISLTSDSQGFFNEIGEALAPYRTIVQGLASFVSGDPDLGDVANIFIGLKEAVFGARARLGGVEKFVSNEMTLTMPYPHPSGLSKIIVRSGGLAQQRWVQPTLVSDPQTNETIFPGVKQRTSALDHYINGQTRMEFDLERIAQGPYWKAFFFNDGENERFFPIMYWFREGEVAVLLVLKLRFVRYNWAPVITTGVSGASSFYGTSSVFVDPEADSVRDGYPVPNGASTEATEMQSCQVIKWRNGNVSLGYRDNPMDKLRIYSRSHSRRLRYPALGSQRNWGVELEVEPPLNLRELIPIYTVDPSPHFNQPNSEPDQVLAQEIPGQFLMPGHSYMFDIVIKDGDPNKKRVRRKLLNVENPQLSITSITPLSILRDGKVVIQGEFGYYSPPGEFGGGGVGMIDSVFVGEERVPWAQTGAQGEEVVIGPITKGGPVILSFKDGSIVTSIKSVGIRNRLGIHPIITSIQPNNARAGEKILIRGQGFASGSGEAMRSATFEIGGIEHPIQFIDRSTVQIRIEEWTQSGYISAKLDDGIGTGVTRFIKKPSGPTV
jgi:hypothetical protein